MISRMPASKRKYFLAAVILFPVAWLIFFSIDFQYDKKDDLGGGMTLVSTVHVDRSPFTAMADSGGSALISLAPYSHSEMLRQKVIRNGAVVWRMDEEIPGLRSYCAAVSPDHHYLLIRQSVGNYWWRIFDIGLQTYQELNIAEMRVPIGRRPHYNSLMFGHWSDDSKFIYAAEDGEEDHEGQRRSYREIYRIAASDLTVEDQEHCHQPLGDPKPEQLSWDHAPCAGSYK